MKKILIGIKPNVPFLEIGFTICIACVSYAYLATYLFHLSLFKQLIILLFCLIGAFLAVHFLFSRIYPWYIQLRNRQKITWVIVSLLISAFIAVVFPLHAPGIFMGDAPYELKITATGQKDVLASSGDVWLDLEAGDTTCPFMSADWFKVKKSWILKDDASTYYHDYFLSYQDQPGVLIWDGYLPIKECSLTFLTNNSSGLVGVGFNQKYRIYDLYSSEPGIIQVPLKITDYSTVPVIASSLLLICSLSFFVLVSGLWFVNRDLDNFYSYKGWKSALLYACPLFIWWGIYLFVFWPGLMSPDSFDQWNQSTTGIINDVHPAFHTLTISLLRFVWDSPAVLPIFQILCLSMLAGIALSRMEYYGANRRLIWTTLILFMISPANSFFVITLWKDVSYSIAILGLFICFFEIAFSNGAWIDKPLNLFIFAFFSMLLSFYRHNGAYTILLIFSCLIIIFFRKRRMLFPYFAFLGALGFLFSRILYSHLGIDSSPTLLYILTPSHHIAAYLAENTPLTSEEKSFLNQIRLVEHNWEYDCYNGDPVIWPKKYDETFSDSVFRDNLQKGYLILFNLIQRAPQVELKHFICVSNALWQITQPYGSYAHTVPLIVTNEEASEILPNTINIFHPITFPKLEKYLIMLFKKSQSIEWNWLVWRPALYLYILLFGVVILAIRKRDPIFLILLIPIVSQEIFILILSKGQELRYHYPIIIISLLYSPYFFLGVNKTE